MKEILDHILRLARLKLPQAEHRRFADKAAHIVEYVEKLKSVPTDSIEPTAHAVEVVNAFREDAVQKFPDPAKILSQAPARRDNLFEVPKVIE